MGSTTDPVLFCPFCREAFEGEQRCPEHELELVRWSLLPTAVPEQMDDFSLPWPSPRFGRGWVAAGAGLSLLAFSALSIARVEGDLRMGGSMLMLALGGTPKLWLVPAAAWAQLMILYRRRSPAAMRGARLAVAIVACIPALAAALTFFDASTAIDAIERTRHLELELYPGAGVYALAIAATSMLGGAIKLGATR